MIQKNLNQNVHVFDPSRQYAIVTILNCGSIVDPETPAIIKYQSGRYRMQGPPKYDIKI